MKTFNAPAIALAGLFLTIPAGAASAATIDYVLSGFATGDYTVLGDPNAVATDFDDVHFRLVLVGDAPGTDVGPDDIIPIDKGRLRVDGMTDRLVLPATELFGIDPLDGDAAFGHEGVSGFVPTVRFGGPGLDGYDGATSLERTPVRADFLKPFRVRVDGETVQVTIDDFTHARFAAIAVPEPTSWALMLAGFGGVGAMLRRRRLPGAA